MNALLKYGVFSMWLLWAETYCAAQGLKDTVINMKVVPVEVQGVVFKENHITAGSDLRLDALYQNGKRLADVLGENTAVFIKNYGTGQLASISVNGSSAAQTAIQWNGIKLNSPATGQVDLALFDMGTIDNIRLNSTACNDAVGGVLSLNNQAAFNKDTLISGNVIRYGSFNTLNLSSNNLYSKGIFSGSTKINYLRSDNDFPFINYTQAGAPIQIQTNAATALLSFLQQLDLRLKKFNTGVMFWVTDADRQLPPVMTDPKGAEHEWDRSYRTMAYLNYNSKKLTVSFKTSYQYDWLRYTNPVGAIDSRSSSQAFRNLFKVSYTIKKFSAAGIINYDHEAAASTGFNYIPLRNISGVNLSASYNFGKSSLIAGSGISLKQDVLENKPLPFTPGAHIMIGKIKRGHAFIAKLNGARAYRLPALNDLYWSTGGNPNLQPEKAWNSSLSLDYNYKDIIKFNATGFYNYVSNWILWTPTLNSIWTAQNVKRVLSRGVNVSMRLQNKSSLTDKGFVVAYYAGYSYTNTISLDAASADDYSKDKQLIYVPLHIFSTSLQLQYRRYYVRTIYSYTGIRYTATDDSQFLPGYYLLHVEAGKDFYFNHEQVGLSFRVNNITNNQYQVIAMRPMPGRSYELTARLNLSK